MKLEHPFILRCVSPIELLDGCEKISTFCGRLEKQAKAYARQADGEVDPDLQNQYKGWGFELFVECLLKCFPMDKRIGISNYKIGDESDDTGVDGTGIGVDGKPATVQVKYRQADYVLSANNDHLGNFKAASLSSRFKVDPTPGANGKCNMLIISTGKELHHHTRDQMLPEVRFLNREQLRVIVDNHVVFWETFRQSWKESLPKRVSKASNKTTSKRVKTKSKVKT